MLCVWECVCVCVCVCVFRPATGWGRDSSSPEGGGRYVTNDWWTGFSLHFPRASSIPRRCWMYPSSSSRKRRPRPWTVQWRPPAAGQRRVKRRSPNVDDGRDCRGHPHPRKWQSNLFSDISYSTFTHTHTRARTQSPIFLFSLFFSPRLSFHWCTSSYNG